MTGGYRRRAARDRRARCVRGVRGGAPRFARDAAPDDRFAATRRAPDVARCVAYGARRRASTRMRRARAESAAAA
ncbi:hypothetical protein DR62_07050 [Burkholderia thailandensis]|uniref:Uncharacterized protein n=1 Tax=Burkholderia thailandensis TaxID=57975 RepID=A0AAW9CXM9_BURTH|nr:hypothetical protein DR62_07050 [Burkholderia thailandensis]AOI54096.1 hypothetical protein WI24_19615 [Burkholderia thailandensis]AOJ53081.1 hypothetical protein AQ475_19435 [Burkholderia thailandensis]AVR28802.1 hypothetical protein A8H32_28785 [Burkholderia thailandensis]MDD1481484.1 hypothetical protein [Burkholderia thailandensis]